MPSDNPGDWPIEIMVHSNDGFIEFAHTCGYSDEAINQTEFQSINSLGLPPTSPFNTNKERVCRIHIPMWGWEVDKEELSKDADKVSFV